MPENRLYSTCFKYNPPKKQRFGGPVFSSALSRNSMSRIREGRTWRFHCNLYIHVRDLYKMVVEFSVVLWVLKLILVWVSTACRESEKVAHGGFIVISIYVIHIKCQDLVVQFSVLLLVGKLILVVWTACRESEKVAQ